jgi:hypothetical protein
MLVFLFLGGIVMWDYLLIHEWLRMIIIAVILFPMIVIGALLRKKAKAKPYNNLLGLIAHFMSILMVVLMFVGDYYIGYFPFGLTTYLIGVGASLLLVIAFAIIWVVFYIRYKKSFLVIE